ALEVIAVNFLQFVYANWRYPNIVINYSASQMFAVDQNDLRVDYVGILNCLTRKIGGCNEDALTCSLSLKCARKLLDFRTAYCAIPSLGLYVNHIAPKTILFDNSI